MFAARLPGRVWTFMENISDTNYNFTLVLRQMYTEAILRERLGEFGDFYHSATQCTDFEIDESAALGSYGVTSTFKDQRTQKTFKIRR